MKFSTRRLLSFLCSFLGGLLIADVVIAQQQLNNQGNQGQRQGVARQSESFFLAQLARNDKDGNGMLSFEEASVERMFRESLFKSIDTNGDGEISKKEATLADKIDKNQGSAKRVSKGSVGLWGWDTYFANFKYTKTE